MLSDISQELFLSVAFGLTADIKGMVIGGVRIVPMVKNIRNAWSGVGAESPQSLMMTTQQTKTHVNLYHYDIYIQLNYYRLAMF